jgi:hypothetical protein
MGEHLIFKDYIMTFLKIAIFISTLSTNLYEMLYLPKMNHHISCI